MATIMPAPAAARPSGGAGRHGDQRPPAPVLACGYYLDNFEAVLASGLERDRDLLAAPELEFLATFSAASLDARRLYARLAARRGPWFRCDRLRYPRYPEIACDRAVGELAAAGLVEMGDDAEISARIELLVRAELLALAAELEPAVSPAAWRSLRRAEFGARVAAIVADRQWGHTLRARVPILRVLRREEVRVFRLLFFGNLAQDWTEFVLADLGVLRFEPVGATGGDARPFSSRAVLDQHLELRRLGERMAAGPATAAEALAPLLSRVVEGGAAAAAAAAAADHWDPSTRRLRDGILLPLARAYERAGAWEPALAAYRAAERPPARERAVRVLRRLGREPEAAELLAAMRAAPRDETERLFGARAGLGARGRRRRPALPERTIEVARLGSAEASALAGLAAEGHAGFFAENWLWRSLFGLAFWDIVFAPVPGAFTHRFQYGPLDLYDGFRAARHDAIAARLESLRRQPRCGPGLVARWHEKFGVANRLVAFARDLEPHLELALAHVSGAELAVIADRLSRDLRRYGHGFPDLFLVGPDGHWSLAEVKAPGDVLRPEQEGWLEYLHAAGMPVRVLHLRWAAGSSAEIQRHAAPARPVASPL